MEGNHTCPSVTHSSLDLQPAGFASTFFLDPIHNLWCRTCSLPSVTVLKESQGLWSLQVRALLILSPPSSTKNPRPVSLVWGNHNSQNWTAYRITSPMGKVFFHRHCVELDFLFLWGMSSIYLRRTPVTLSINRPRHNHSTSYQTRLGMVEFLH